ncbi:DUF1996 domain-containing protein [Streptomyces sp. NPDC048172]|uniref:DUF1996 domain-containing protein n=1 Tax=Streptomyces sp. NPDC048172 TaxID=3365505 RepID=UPI003721FB75
MRQRQQRGGAAHRRSRRRRTLVALGAALVLGAGAATYAGVNASAGEGSSGDGARERGQRAGQTIDCPDVSLALGEVPQAARKDVAEGLAALDRQVATAYHRLASGAGDTDKVMDELRARRAPTIGGIADNVRGEGGRPPGGMDGMSDCRVRQRPAEDREGQDGAGQDGGGQGGAGQGGVAEGEPPPAGGPVPADFVDITTVEPNRQDPEPGEDASTGSFTTKCGRNEEGHFNSDNVIAAPGVSNGAHHTHDYVGNVSTDAFSTNESLAAARSTCRDGDLSTYYWPVLRALDGNQEGGHDGNAGTVLKPSEVTLTFKGSAVGDVTAMPRFLRIITGDAKSFTNGTANANASWSCEGFEDRQLKDKYPLCPEGSRVIRSFDFQSCWDGRNTDSGNHRDHVAFAREDGSCPDGFRAVPQLRQRIAYEVPREGVPKGTPFAVDSFPEQLHKPVTDHGDFINVMPDRLMKRAVRCINGGKDCG